MVRRNPCIAALKAGYLFPEIRKRKEAYLAAHPEADVVSLGIGDTTEPLSEGVVARMAEEARALGTAEGYRGYGDDQGDLELREAIAARYYRGIVSPSDIFISDGSKCDAGRLQILFGRDVTIAVQDPVYPVYTDTSLILGQRKIEWMPCTPENGFFPASFPKADLIFFCSPNNPTGALATREELQALVDHAKATGAIILFDAAYAAFVQEGPRSIFEIPGADEVAIEMGSFSKMSGFTGVRLGWTVVPEKLKFADGSSVKRDWQRVVSTFFNGASRLAVKGALGALEDLTAVSYYMENAALLKKALAGFEIYGGAHIPYLFVRKGKMTSWELFDWFLEELQILTVPGSGFGPSGEGFVRLSAFAKRERIAEASRRLKHSALAL